MSSSTTSLNRWRLTSPVSRSWIASWWRRAASRPATYTASSRTTNSGYSSGIASSATTTIGDRLNSTAAVSALKPKSSRRYRRTGWPTYSATATPTRIALTTNSAAAASATAGRSPAVNGTLTPAIVRTTLAAASEIAYWPTLKATRHSGLRETTSSTTEATDWAATAGQRPASSSSANAKVVLTVSSSCSPRRGIFSGSNSPSNTPAASRIATVRSSSKRSALLASAIPTNSTPPARATARQYLRAEELMTGAKVHDDSRERSDGDEHPHNVELLHDQAPQDGYNKGCTEGRQTSPNPQPDLDARLSRNPVPRGALPATWRLAAENAAMQRAWTQRNST